MPPKKPHKINLQLEDEDEEAIKLIKSRRGYLHTSAAIRYALRTIARQLRRAKNEPGE